MITWTLNGQVIKFEVGSAIEESLRTLSTCLVCYHNFQGWLPFPSFIMSANEKFDEVGRSNLLTKNIWVWFIYACCFFLSRCKQRIKGLALLLSFFLLNVHLFSFYKQCRWLRQLVTSRFKQHTTLKLLAYANAVFKSVLIMEYQQHTDVNWQAKENLHI